MKKFRSAGADGRPPLLPSRHKQNIAVALALLTVLAWGWTDFTRWDQITYSVLEHRLESLWVAVWGLPWPEAVRTGSIEGTVRDEQGKPLPGTFVVAGDRWGRAASAQTDEQGHYRLEGVPAGRTVPAATADRATARMYA